MGNVGSPGRRSDLFMFRSEVTCQVTRLDRIPKCISIAGMSLCCCGGWAWDKGHRKHFIVLCKGLPKNEERKSFNELCNDRAPEQPSSITQAEQAPYSHFIVIYKGLPKSKKTPKKRGANLWSLQQYSTWAALQYLAEQAPYFSLYNSTLQRSAKIKNKKPKKGANLWTLQQYNTSAVLQYLEEQAPYSPQPNHP